MEAEQATPQTIDEYIAAAAPEVRPLLEEVRATIRKAAPDATEAIKYRMPTFVANENLVHFAVFKSHIGFYPTSSGIAAFQDALAPYKSSKGAVQFPLDQPLPLELIRRIVAFRVKESEDRASRRRKPKQGRDSGARS